MSKLSLRFTLLAVGAVEVAVAECSLLLVQWWTRVHLFGAIQQLFFYLAMQLISFIWYSKVL